MGTWLLQLWKLSVQDIGLIFLAGQQFTNLECGTASARFATIDLYRSVSKCVNPSRKTSNRNFLMLIVTSFVVFSVLHRKANLDLQLCSVFLSWCLWQLNKNSSPVVVLNTSFLTCAWNKSHCVSAVLSAISVPQIRRCQNRPVVAQGSVAGCLPQRLFNLGLMENWMVTEKFSPII